MELQDDICSTTPLLSFWKKLKAYLFTKAYPPKDLLYFRIVSVVWFPPSVSLHYDLFGFVSWLSSLRICLLIEIKCYYSHTRTKIELEMVDSSGTPQ